MFRVLIEYGVRVDHAHDNLRCSGIDNFSEMLFQLTDMKKLEYKASVNFSFSFY